MDSDFNLHWQRESNKMSLALFVHNNEIAFTYSIDKAIDELRRENECSINQINKLEILGKEKLESCEELDEQINQYEFRQQQIHGHVMDVEYNNDELRILSEMKIIYCFRELEIRVKNLLRASLSAKTTSFYRWENMIQYLKSKNINVKDIQGYDEVEQLRKVNNCLKHSDILSDDLEKIIEFTGLTQISYVELENFFARIKTFPHAFLQNLTDSIYSYLYDFDEVKLAEIAKYFVLRMDKESAFRLADKLRENY